MSTPGEGPPEQPQQPPQPEQPRQPEAPPGAPAQPGYYPRYGMGYPRNANGTMILVLGILSLVICGLLGPVAWIMGNNSLRDINAGLADPNERGLVVAGRILGMITCAFVVLACCFYIGFFGLMFSAVTVGSPR